MLTGGGLGGPQTQSSPQQGQLSPCFELLPLLYPADGPKAAAHKGAEEQQNGAEGRQAVEDLRASSIPPLEVSRPALNKPSCIVDLRFAASSVPAQTLKKAYDYYNG